MSLEAETMMVERACVFKKYSPSHIPRSRTYPQSNAAN